MIEQDPPVDFEVVVFDRGTDIEFRFTIPAHTVQGALAGALEISGQELGKPLLLSKGEAAQLVRALEGRHGPASEELQDRLSRLWIEPTIIGSVADSAGAAQELVETVLLVTSMVRDIGLEKTVDYVTGGVVTAIGSKVVRVASRPVSRYKRQRQLGRRPSDADIKTTAREAINGLYAGAVSGPPDSFSVSFGQGNDGWSAAWRRSDGVYEAKGEIFGGHEDVVVTRTEVSS